MNRDALARLEHDLRSPLTVIAGFADLLARPGEVPEEERRAHARRIADAAAEMRALLDESRRSG